MIRMSIKRLLAASLMIIHFASFGGMVYAQTVDTSELQAVIQTATDYLDGSYTDESTAFLQQCIACAQTQLTTSDQTQTRIDNHLLLLSAAMSAMQKRQQSGQLYPGTYTLQARLKHATMEQDSMGNAAISNPVYLTVDAAGNCNAQISLLPITLPFGGINLQGYLAYFSYFSNYDSAQPPAGLSPQAATVEQVFEGVYDSYNHPDTGTDASVKGILYPQKISIPVQPNQQQIWTQVYVPVMESISAGSGNQYARLQLDWSTLSQQSGQQTDKNALVQYTQILAQMLQNLTTHKLQYQQLVQSAVSYAQVATVDMNVSQQTTDALVIAMQRIQNLLTDSANSSDKTALKNLVEQALQLLMQTEVSYTAQSKEALRSVTQQAQELLDQSSAGQTQINQMLKSLQSAIDGLQVDGVDKRDLKLLLQKAAEYLENYDSYQYETAFILEKVYQLAQGVYDDLNATQVQVDLQTEQLHQCIAALRPEGVLSKTLLQQTLAKANAACLELDKYTAISIEALQKVVAESKIVLDDPNASQTQLDRATISLMEQLAKLELLKSDQKIISAKELKDGVYSISGRMVKIDRKSYSMADNAINHTIKLTVKNGEYSLSLDFSGLSINGSFGYLGEMKYFGQDYMVDSSGSLSGTVQAVQVQSYQKDRSGKLIQDNYGTNYPDVVTFPVIPKAKEDGYIPLQVFVPIMNAISPGAGTQPVYLKVDWDSVRTVDDESIFKTIDEIVSTGKKPSASNFGIASTLPTTQKQEGTLQIGSGFTPSIQTAPIVSSATNGAQTVQQGTETDAISQQAQKVRTTKHDALIITVLTSCVFVLIGIIYKLQSKRM